MASGVGFTGFEFRRAVGKLVPVSGGGVAFSPTLVQGVALTLGGAAFGRYVVSGRIALVEAYLPIASGTGTSGALIVLGGMPPGIQALSAGVNMVLAGAAKLYDSSASLIYLGLPRVQADGSVIVEWGSGVSDLNWGQAASPYALQLGAGDYVAFSAAWIF